MQRKRIFRGRKALGFEPIGGGTHFYDFKPAYSVGGTQTRDQALGVAPVNADDTASTVEFNGTTAYGDTGLDIPTDGITKWAVVGKFNSTAGTQFHGSDLGSAMWGIASSNWVVLGSSSSPETVAADTGLHLFEVDIVDGVSITLSVDGVIVATDTAPTYTDTSSLWQGAVNDGATGTNFSNFTCLRSTIYSGSTVLQDVWSFADTITGATWDDQSASNNDMTVTSTTSGILSTTYWIDTLGYLRGDGGSGGGGNASYANTEFYPDITSQIEFKAAWIPDGTLQRVGSGSSDKNCYIELTAGNVLEWNWGDGVDLTAINPGTGIQTYLIDKGKLYQDGILISDLSAANFVGTSTTPFWLSGRSGSTAFALGNTYWATLRKD